MFGSLGAGGGSAAPSAKSASVAAGTSGVVYAITRLLGSTSTLSLLSGTNANLTLSGANISATAAIAGGASQKAIVREVSGDQAVEYGVTITASTPPGAINKLLAAGDSITYGGGGNSYAWKWGVANPTKTMVVNAQDSRVLGTPANLDDGGNSLYGHRTEMLAQAPQLFTVFIGTNGPFFTAGANVEQYWSDFKAFMAPIRAAVGKIGIVTLTPTDYRRNANNDYIPYNSQRLAYNAIIRSRFNETADFVIDFGAIPEFNDTDGSVINPSLIDGTHYNSSGVSLTTDVYAAATDPAVNGSTASGPPSGAWFGAGSSNADINTTLKFRYIITGMRPGLGVNVSLSQAAIDAGVRFQIGRTANLTASSGAMNGDVVILSVPTGSVRDVTIPTALTIGSTTVSVPVKTAATNPAVITFNPADKNQYVSLSNLNRRMTVTTGGPIAKARVTAAVSGKRYVEGMFVDNAGASSQKSIGIVNAAYALTNINSTNHPGAAAQPNVGCTILGSAIYANGAVAGNTGVADFVDGDRFMLAINTDLKKVWYGKNGSWGTGQNPVTGAGGITFTTAPDEWFLWCALTGGDFIDLNCGQEDFVHIGALADAGFLAWG